MKKKYRIFNALADNDSSFLSPKIRSQPESLRVKMCLSDGEKLSFNTSFTVESLNYETHRHRFVTAPPSEERNNSIPHSDTCALFASPNGLEFLMNLN